MLLRRGLPPQNQAVVGAVADGSVLQVISKSPDQEQENWLQIRVCTAKTQNVSSPGDAATSTPSPQPVKTPAPRPQGKTPAKSVTPSAKPAAVTYRQVVAGDGGWIKEADVLGSVDPTFSATADQRRECLTPTTAPAPSPSPKPS